MEDMLTFHILNVYVDKTQPHQFKYTFNMKKKKGIVRGTAPEVMQAVAEPESHVTFRMRARGMVLANKVDTKV